MFQNSQSILTKSQYSWYAEEWPSHTGHQCFPVTKKIIVRQHIR